MEEIELEMIRRERWKARKQRGVKRENEKNLGVKGERIRILERK